MSSARINHPMSVNCTLVLCSELRRLRRGSVADEVCATGGTRARLAAKEQTEFGQLQPLPQSCRWVLPERDSSAAESTNWRSKTC